MNFKTFFVLIVILFIAGIAAAAYATYPHSAFRVADGKDIDLNSREIGNGTISGRANLTYGSITNVTMTNATCNQCNSTTNATLMTSGTIPPERYGTGILQANISDLNLSAANPHNLNANNLSSGTIPAARLAYPLMNNGTWSTAFGTTTVASGQYSTAMGQDSTASGYASTAMGLSTTASGTSSVAIGLSTTASGQSSTVFGFSTTASGQYSTAIGKDITNNEASSVWIGTATGNILKVNTTNVTISSLSGSGNDYVCVNPAGSLFRSNTAC